MVRCEALSRGPIDHLYLDNTYLDPASGRLPSRAAALERIVAVIDAHKDEADVSAPIVRILNPFDSVYSRPLTRSRVRLRLCLGWIRWARRSW